MQQQIDYSKWNNIDIGEEGENDLPNEEALKLQIDWHSKLNMADHQFYIAENSKQTKDYDRAIAGYNLVLQQTEARRKCGQKSITDLAIEIKITCLMNCICCYIRKDEWIKALEICKRISTDSLARQKLTSLETLRLMYFRCFTMIMALDSSRHSSSGEVFNIDRSRKVNEITMELQDMHKFLQLAHGTQENSKYFESAVEDFREVVDLFNKTVRNATAAKQEPIVPLPSAEPSVQDYKEEIEEGDKELDDGVKKVEVGQQLLREGKYKEAYQWHSAAISSQSPHPSKKPELCELLSGRARASAGMGEQKQAADAYLACAKLLHPGSEKISNSIRAGSTYFKIKDYANSAAAYEFAMGLFRNDSLAGSCLIAQELFPEKPTERDLSPPPAQWKRTADTDQYSANSALVPSTSSTMYSVVQCGLGACYVYLGKAVDAKSLLLDAINSFEEQIFTSSSSSPSNLFSPVHRGDNEEPVLPEGSSSSASLQALMSKINREKSFLIPTIQHLLTGYESLADCFAMLNKWDECDQVSDRVIDTCNSLIRKIQNEELFESSSSRFGSSSAGSGAVKTAGTATKTPQRRDYAFSVHETPSYSSRMLSTPGSFKWGSADVEVSELMKLLLKKRAFGYISKGKLYHLKDITRLNVRSSPRSTAVAFTPASTALASKRGAFFKLEFSVIKDTAIVGTPAVVTTTTTSHTVMQTVSKYGVLSNMKRGLGMWDNRNQIVYESTVEAIVSYWEFAASEFLEINDFPESFRTYKLLGEYYLEVTKVEPFQFESSLTATITYAYNDEKIAIDVPEFSERGHDAWRCAYKVATKIVSKLDDLQATSKDTDNEQAAKGSGSKAAAKKPLTGESSAMKILYLQESMLALYNAGLCAMRGNDVNLAQRAFESALSVRDDLDSEQCRHCIDSSSHRAMMIHSGRSVDNNNIMDDISFYESDEKAAEEDGDRVSSLSAHSSSQKQELPQSEGYLVACGDICFHLGQTYLKTGDLHYVIQEADHALTYYNGLVPISHPFYHIQQQQLKALKHKTQQKSSKGSPKDQQMHVVRQRHALGLKALALSAMGQFDEAEAMLKHIKKSCKGPLEDPEKEIEPIRSAMKQRRPPLSKPPAPPVVAPSEAVPDSSDWVTNMSTLDTPSAPKINVRLFAGDTDVDRSMARRPSIMAKSQQQQLQTQTAAVGQKPVGWFARWFGGTAAASASTTAGSPLSVRPDIMTPIQPKTPRAKAKREVEQETDFYLITSYAILCAIFSVFVALAVKVYLK